MLSNAFKVLSLLPGTHRAVSAENFVCCAEGCACLAGQKLQRLRTGMLQWNAKASATCNWPSQYVTPLQALKAGGRLLIRDHGIYDITQLRCTYLVCCEYITRQHLFCTHATSPISWPVCIHLHCTTALPQAGLHSTYR